MLEITISPDWHSVTWLEMRITLDVSWVRPSGTLKTFDVSWVILPEMRIQLDSSSVTISETLKTFELTHNMSTAVSQQAGGQKPGRRRRKSYKGLGRSRAAACQPAASQPAVVSHTSQDADKAWRVVSHNVRNVLKSLDLFVLILSTLSEMLITPD